MLHGIGLYHTHTRTDRDEHITINSNNIAARRKNEFDMCTRNCKTYDTPYDCDSIMHYASNQMATDKDKATICEIIINIVLNLITLSQVLLQFPDIHLAIYYQWDDGMRSRTTYLRMISSFWEGSIQPVEY